MNDRVVGIILEDQKILLFWRYSKGREYYIFPGGTLEDDEEEKKGLVRELFEELNLDITIEKKLFTLFNEELEPRHDHYFLITEFTGVIKMGAPELTHQHRENIFRPEWVPFDKLPELPLVPEEGKKKIVGFLDTLTLTP